MSWAGADVFLGTSLADNLDSKGILKMPSFDGLESTMQLSVQQYSTWSHCHDIKKHQAECIDGIKNSKEFLASKDSPVLKSVAGPRNYNLSGHALVDFSRGALRRHRKVLARIVVDHWLQKARMRLLVLRLQTIQKKRMKSFYFEAWRRFTARNLARGDKIWSADHFSKMSIKKRTFFAWTAIYKHEKMLWTTFKHLFQEAKKQAFKGMLSLWYEHACQHMVCRRWSAIADRFRNLSLLSSFFVNWQIGVQNIQNGKYLRKLALGFWARKRLNLAWQALRICLVIWHTHNLVQERRMKMLMRSVFKQWHHVAVERSKKVSEYAMSLLKRLLLQKSCTCLHDHALSKRKIRLNKGKASNFQHMKCKQNAYRLWHEYTESRYKCWRDALLLHQFNLLSCAFKKWRSVIREQEEFANAWYKYKLCFQSMIGWKKFVMEGSCKSNKASIYHAERKSMCIVSQVTELLKAHNRLLQRQFSCMTQLTRKSFLQRRRTASIIIAQAQALYRKCFQKLKAHVQKDLKQLTAFTCQNEQKALKATQNDESSSDSRHNDTQLESRVHVTTATRNDCARLDDTQLEGKLHFARATKSGFRCDDTQTEDLLDVPGPTVNVGVRHNDTPMEDVLHMDNTQLEAGLHLARATSMKLVSGLLHNPLQSTVNVEDTKAQSTDAGRNYLLTSLSACQKPSATSFSSFPLGRLHNVKAGISGRPRLPARRPTYVHGNISGLCCGPRQAHVDNYICGGACWSNYYNNEARPLNVLEQIEALNPVANNGLNSPLLSSRKKHLGAESRIHDAKLVKEELVWTEDQLSSFNHLKIEMNETITELSALQQNHKSEESQAERAQYLEQKIVVLQQRLASLSPSIQGLKRRASDLQKMLEDQLLHLD